MQCYWDPMIRHSAFVVIVERLVDAEKMFYNVTER